MSLWDHPDDILGKILVKPRRFLGLVLLGNDVDLENGPRIAKLIYVLSGRHKSSASQAI